MKTREVYEAAMNIYLKVKDYSSVIRIFETMNDENLMISQSGHRIFLYALTEDLRYEELCPALQQFTFEFGFKSTVYENIISYFCEYNRIEESVYFFDSMEKPTVSAFSSLAVTCVKANDYETLNNLLIVMQRHGFENISETALPFIIDGCTQSQQTSKALHTLNNNLDFANITIINKIIQGFINEHNLIHAVEIVKKMEEKYKITPNINSFAPIISYLIENQSFQDAEKIFHIMGKDLLSCDESCRIYNLMLTEYFLNNDIHKIEQVVTMMRENNALKQKSSFVILFCGYVKMNLNFQANKILKEMVSLNLAPKSPAEKSALFKAQRGNNTALAAIFNKQLKLK